MATRQLLADLAAACQAAGGPALVVESVGGVDAARRVREVVQSRRAVREDLALPPAGTSPATDVRARALAIEIAELSETGTPDKAIDAWRKIVTATPTHRAPRRGLARVLRQVDGDLDEAEDLVQQSFVKLWEQRATFQVQWSVKAYLYKMVHNRCLNRLRDAQTREKYKVYNAAQLEQGYENDPGAASELNERILQALDTLPTECRRIFELSRFEELKYREIADQLGISIKTVETQMGKALRLMRTELADYLITLIALLQWMLL